MSDSFIAVRDAVEGLADAHRAFTETSNAKLDAMATRLAENSERLDHVEAKSGRPVKITPAPAAAFKSYETRNGPVYDLPASVKMAEACPPTCAAPVSFERWLSAFAAGERCEDKEALDFARDRKQLVTTTTGTLIPAEYQSDWIDRIREQSVLSAAGMGLITMGAKTYNASAVTADPAATWHTEAGSISAGNPTFAARTMTAQTLVVRCQASVELTQDSPDFSAQLAGVMARSMGAEIDRVALHGSGSAPEPQGLYGASGVQTVTGAATSNYSALITGVRKLLDQNLTLEEATANVILPPRIWQLYESQATGISGDGTQLARPRSLENTAFRVTPHGATTTESPTINVAFLGRFSDLALGVRAEASVEMLKLSTYATNLEIEFVGYLRADFLIRRPASFCTVAYTAT